MPTRRQHFVPRVYIKAWETEVTNKNEPNKKFQGVYYHGMNGSDGKTKESILWKPHLYTIGFKHSFICKSCPKVKSDFVGMIYNYLRKKENPVYGKYEHSVIKTKRSIEKHLFQIQDWQFFYDNGNVARKASILNYVNDLNSYILESAFDDFLEKNWERTYKDFVSAVHYGRPFALESGERVIPTEIAENMLSAFFIMLCRNPSFDAMGIYSSIKNNVLYPVFNDMFRDITAGNNNTDGQDLVDELMEGMWYAELYRMFYKKTGGFYHNVIEKSLERLQMTLFEAYDGAGDFITSDNPAFEHKLIVETDNNNGFVFPLSPKYLIFIARGNEGINVVDYRFANTDTIRHFNRLIALHKTEAVISNQADISRLL